MNLDGSGFRQLTNDGKFKFLPHFSPDATKIVYTKFSVGGYGSADALTDIAVYDLASSTETMVTSGGNNGYGTWSPDGSRIAYLNNVRLGRVTGPTTIMTINADGSNPHIVGTASGAPDDWVWGDIAWSSTNWILFVVGETVNGTFCKSRVDKIRPDGSSRTQVSDGGPSCTPPGVEAIGDADPGWSSDAETIYSSRGFPVPPASGPAAATERKLYAFSSEPWSPGKVEHDLSLPTEPSCIEGVPKGSPDGKRVLLFRFCFDTGMPKGGIYLTDIAGSYRTFVADGFGPDWNPIAAVNPIVNLDQHGLTGSWYNPATGGQGIEMEVYPDLIGPGQGLLFAGWFTFDVTAAGGQRWYVLSGNVSNTSASAQLTIGAVDGGNFNAPPALGASVVGQATLRFSDCNDATLNYIFTDGSGRSGTIPLSRLTTNITCSATGDNGSAPTDYLLSGNWYDSTTGGQGFMFDINPTQSLLFAAWYTFAPNGQQIAGPSSEHWYTLQTGVGSFVGGTTQLNDVVIGETTGGVFNNPARATTVQVGSANIAFQSCNAMTLAYTFTSGTNQGKSGTINLQRTGPTPAGCALAFSNPMPVTITGYTGDAMEPFISKDGQYLFFNNRNDPSINTDIYCAARVDDQTFTFLGPVAGVNSPQLDAVTSLDALGNFYFVSTRSYAATSSTIYSGRFSAGSVGNIALVSGISLQQAGWVNFDAEISADGQTLWFDDGQYSSVGVLQQARIVIANRQGSTFVRQANSATLLATVNASGLNYAPSISVDGLELFFTRVDSTTSGASPAIYHASRTDTNSAFGTPELVAAATGFVEAPSLSANGHLLYFHKLLNGTFVIYHLQR